jgi:hypothetical protein
VYVLTLTQPYATLVALLAKGNETRSWRTHYRGPLAVHAAQGLGPVDGLRGFQHLAASQPFWSVLEAAGFGPHRGPTFGLPLGVVVAVCDLAGCYPAARTDDGSEAYCIRAGKQHKDRDLIPVWGSERAFGDYSLGRWVWVLKDVQALPEPISARGKMGLWGPGAALHAQIEAATRS